MRKLCSLLLIGCLMLPTGAFAADNASDSAHMNQVLEQDSSYEGFLANSETLTFEEIASLPVSFPVGSGELTTASASIH